MFWHAVVKGFSAFLHWETYVIGVVYLIISWLPFIPILFSKEDDFGKSGCLSMILQPLFMGLGVFVYIASLFPIIIGFGDHANWSLPWLMIVRMPWIVLDIIVASLVLGFLGGLIPILGKSNGFLILIIGGTVLVFLLAMVHKIHPEIGLNHIDQIPGFLTIIGIVIVSAISSWLGMVIAAVIATALDKISEGIQAVEKPAFRARSHCWARRSDVG